MCSQVRDFCSLQSPHSSTSVLHLGALSISIGENAMATGGDSVFGANPGLGQRNFPNPVWAEDEGFNGFFMAPCRI